MTRELQNGSLANGSVEFVGVSGRDGVDAMSDFIAQYDLANIEHIADEDGSVWLGFEVTSQPAWAFINDDGSVEVVRGALGADGLRERIEALAAT